MPDDRGHVAGSAIDSPIEDDLPRNCEKRASSEASFLPQLDRPIRPPLSLGNEHPIVLIVATIYPAGGKTVD